MTTAAVSSGRSPASIGLPPAPGDRALTPVRGTLCVGLLAALVKLTLAAPFLARYGWDRDELYFLAASRHLSLGYVDFPMITALIGRLTIDLAGPSLVALRLTGVVAGMLSAVLVALCARELEGGLRAQLVAGLAFVLTPFGLGIGAIFHPTMFDLLAWVAFSYLALRILRRPEPRLWPWLGLVAGLGLETKGTVAALLVVFTGGLLLVGPRGFVRDRRFWTGVGIAMACLAPYLAWEMAHGWPSVTFLPSQDAVTAASTPRVTYVVQQVAFVGGAVALVAVGVRELWRDRRVRVLALLAPITALVFFVEQGRSYYSLPAIALPLAAGAVAADRWWRRSHRRALVLAPLLALQLAALVVAAPIVWPVLPTGKMVKLGLWKPSFYKDELGWPQLVAETASAWRALPAAQRRGTALLAGNYGEAGALALYGPAAGLPQPLSGHLSFQYWHPRRMPQRRALIVGYGPASLAMICTATHIVGRVENRWDIANQEQGQTIVTCTLRRPLGVLWARDIATDRL
jgi:4-amino-4-deoxy-L-arabinose transferase-like glycosyltransferase